MKTKPLLISALLTGCVVAMALAWGAASQGGASDRALADSLANDTTRQAAIASIMASGSSKVPLLLSWARKPPRHVLGCGLDDGLADAFGELKTKEAIPFLIKNIGMYRSCGVSLGPWLKGPAAIEWNLPAVGALVKIGADASKGVIAEFHDIAEENRMAAIFVVSQIKGVPEAQVFLAAAVGRANGERYWAEEGIKLLDASPSPR